MHGLRKNYSCVLLTCCLMLETTVLFSLTIVLFQLNKNVTIEFLVNKGMLLPYT